MDARLGQFAWDLAQHAETTFGMVLLDLEGRYLLISKALAAANGHTVEECIGRHPRDIAPDLWAQAERHLARVAGGEAVQFEVTDRMPRATGYRRVMDVHAFPVCDSAQQGPVAIGIAVEDITSRRAEETALETAPRRAAVATLAEQALQGQTGIPELCALAAAEVAVTLGTPISRVVRPMPGTNQIVMLGGVGMEWDAEQAGLRPNSLVDFVMRSPTPVVVDDLATETRFRPPQSLLARGVRSTLAVPVRGPRGTVGMLSTHSLEPRHFSDDEQRFLEEVANVLSLAMQTREAMTFQRELISITSHEMRTPLTTIIGMGQRLQRRLARADGHAESADLAELAGLVAEEGMRLNAMIDRWLGVTEVHTGPYERSTAPVDLVALTGRVIALARERHLAMTALEQYEVGALEVVTNAAQVSEILDNLIENAVRYVGPGATVTVGVSGDARLARLTVTDDGPGVPPEAQPFIFDRFYRGTTASKGLGVGLYVSRVLAEELGGTLTLEASHTDGASFLLTLPR